MSVPPREDSADRVTVGPTDDRGDDAVVRGWTASLNAALVDRDHQRLAALFSDDGCLRDIVALTWHFHTYYGNVEVAQALLNASEAIGTPRFELTATYATKTKTKVDGTRVVEAILDVETKTGRGHAVLRLTDDGTGAHRARLLATVLVGLADHPERTGDHRIVGTPSLDTFAGRNWLDRREHDLTYADKEPDVLVVGGGQSGLGLAARLRTLDVDVLVIDRLPRVGDVWRNRYHSLTLHNPVWLNHLPYMPFPENWPVYIPKDKLANWFESYADAMELNVWPGTELVGATFDTNERWTAQVSTEGAAPRTIRPRHIVLATGANGTPRWSHIPGLEDYQGTAVHSAAFDGGQADVKPRHAIVFGTGNSGHDVAQDLYANTGCQVTMIQRGSTTVVDLSTVHAIYDRYSTRLSPEHADLMLMATPYQHSIEAFRSMTRRARERDFDLISRLNQVGFRTDYGDDDTGHRMKYLRYGGGYYINVGCSNLIADGAIGLVQYDEVDTVVADGVRLRDGSTIEADLIVVATGYENQEHLVEQVFGDEVARRVGPIWGYDEEGELRAMYKRTAQPGLWFHAGSLTQARIYSQVVALQIKACLEGLIELVPNEQSLI